MKKEENIIETFDYRQKQVIFTKRKWKNKALQHPQLLNITFLKNVQKTIENPEQVWQDYSAPKQKQCYYKKYSANSYVKIVIWTSTNPCMVITAYETNLIKEQKYHALKRFK